MATIYTSYDSNIRKTWLLMGLFMVFIAAVGWTFSYIYDTPAIFMVAVIFSVVMNIGSYWFSDRLVLGMYRARQVQESDNPDLWHVVENLSITAGLPMPRLFIIDDPAPNAFATGRNKNHAAVVVTAGLLSRLNRSELEGVIAHELSHIGNRDILLQTVIVVLVGFVTILADMFLRTRLLRSGGNRNEKSEASGILLVLGVVFIILSPIIGQLIKLAISRKREFLADASGALLTRYPEGLASALEKISSYDGALTRANNATAHMFISNPFGARAGKGIAKLFMTHPPVEERIQALRGL